MLYCIFKDCPACALAQDAFKIVSVVRSICQKNAHSCLGVRCVCQWCLSAAWSDCCLNSVPQAVMRCATICTGEGHSDSEPAIFQLLQTHSISPQFTWSWAGGDSSTKLLQNDAPQNLWVNSLGSRQLQALLGIGEKETISEMRTQ
jgi:hypothetical protein